MSNKTIGVFENQSVDMANGEGQQLFRQVNLVGLESLLRDCPSLKAARRFGAHRNAFVAARKLVDDAIGTLKNREAAKPTLAAAG
jgi:hypothetical protein